MSVQLTVTLPDELMTWLTGTATESFRSPEGQLLWLLTSTRTRNEQRQLDSLAIQRLHQELRKLHLTAGLPSVRVIAARVRQQGHQIGHSSVHDVLRGNRLPPWPSLKAIVAVLDGDQARFKVLWANAHGDAE